MRSLIERPLPRHWRIAKLSLVAKLGTGHTPGRSKPEYWMEPRSIPWLTTSDIERFRDGRVTEITKTKESISELGLENSAAVLHPKGTVALSRTASVGFGVIMGRDMATSQDFFTWTCSPELHPRYLLMCLRAGNQDLTRGLAMGSTHKTIYMPDIQQLRVPLPPVDEQRRIADRVDAETARIDALLDRNERLSSLAHERYLASIDTISRRRCPRSIKLKRVTRIAYGLGQPPPTSRTGIPIIRATNIDRGKIRPANMIYAAVDDLPLDRAPLLDEGEILVVRSGALTGDSAIVPADWAGSAPGYDLRITAVAIDPAFLAHQLLGPRVQTQIRVMRARAAQPHINAEDLGDLSVSSGSASSERLAAKELDEVQTWLEALDTATSALATAMHDRRDSLITAAVTGQLDPSYNHGSAVAA